MEHDRDESWIPVILTQKKGFPVRMDFPTSRGDWQSKPALTDILTNPEDHWDREKCKITWRMISGLMDDDLLSHEDMLQFLTCRNLHTSLHIWGGGQMFIEMQLLERPDFEKNKCHLIQMLTERDDQYDPAFGRFAYDGVSFMMKYHCITIQDILTLLVSTNDSICLAAWSRARFLACQGYVSDSDLAKHKSWFLGLLADHPDAWDPQGTRYDEEDDLWSAIAYMAENKILTQQDISGLLDRDHDSLTAAVWLHAEPLRRLGLLDLNDLRRTKDRFLRIARLAVEGAAFPDLALPGWDLEIPLWRVIRNAVSREWEVITPGDHAFFTFLLSSQNDGMCLSVWKDGDNLVQRDFLQREDFLYQKDRLNALLLAGTIWQQGTMEENKRLMKFLLDLGLCTPEAIRQAADDGSENLPFVARSVLRDLASDETIRTLQHDLENADPGMKTVAARDLELVDDPRTSDRIVPLLRHRDARVRYHAAEIIGNRNARESTFSPLILSLGDDDPNVRFQVAKALLRHVSSRVAETYATARDVRYRAFDEIASGPLADEIIVAAMEKDARIFREIAALVVRGKWMSEDSFIGALKQGEPFALHSAATAIFSIAPDSVIADLAAATASADAERKIPFIRALGRFRSVRAAGAILPAIADPSADVRFAAARALGTNGVVQTAEYLVVLLIDRNYGVRYSAAEALGKIGSENSADALIRALADPDEAVRFHAARALGKIGSGRGITPLTAAVQDSNILVSTAARDALQQIDKLAEASSAEQKP